MVQARPVHPDPARDRDRRPRSANRPARTLEPDRRSILLSDRETLFRDGLARLLPRHGPFRIVASTDSLATSIVEANRLRPDVVLAGAELVDGEIRELIERLAHVAWNARVIVLCSDATEITYFGPHVDAVLPRAASLAVLMDVLQRPADMSARAVVPGPRVPRAPPGYPTRDPRGLPRRQRDILMLVARGWPNRDIADHLGLREKSVRNYLTDAYKHLHVRSRTEAALVMLRHGYGADP